MAPPYHGDRHDQQYQHHHPLNLEEVPQTSFNSSSTTSSLSSPVFFTPAQVVEGPRPDHHFREPQDFHFQLLEADHNIVSYGGSCDGDHQTVENEAQKSNTLRFSISKSGDAKNGNISSTHEEIKPCSVKWMSSKMRMMRKMTNPDQTTSSSTTSSEDKPISMNFSNSHKLSEEINMNNAPIVRVCSDCNTTKTPLWRSGPRGPKSLCNACGIRQRKARRAMAAAAAAASGATLAVAAPTSTTNSKAQKEHKSSSPKSTLPFKKRCNKLITPTPARGRPKKICFEDHFTIAMKNRNNSPSAAAATATATAAASLQAVFPQDEKEAAILLMALSCGLVHG